MGGKIARIVKTGITLTGMIPSPTKQEFKMTFNMKDDYEDEIEINSRPGDGTVYIRFYDGIEGNYASTIQMGLTTDEAIRLAAEIVKAAGVSR